MQVLVVANYLPYPLVSGGRIRVYNLLRAVARRHEVFLAALMETPEDAEGIPHLQQICARVETASLDRRSRLAKAPGMLRYAVDGKPPELKLLHSDELVEKIRRIVSEADVAIVQIESVMGLYLDALPRASRCKSIEMFQNVSSQQFRRIASIHQASTKSVRAWLTGVTMGRWEPRFAERFDRCTTVSEKDKQLLLVANPRLRVDVIPNGVDIERYQVLPPPSARAPAALLFVGSMGYPPCVDAVRYFCAEILPVIRQGTGSIAFWIVGGGPPPQVVQLGGNGVHVTGRVDDVIPYYENCTICVVPLRAGGGTRLKILEAMALGRPVVSTTIGCEGLEAVDGEHLLIADTPSQFADKTLALLRDPRLYRHITANGRQLVAAKYGWDKIGDRLLDIYQEVVAEPDA